MIRNLCRAAGIAVLMAAAPGAYAATPENLDLEQAAVPVAAAPAVDYVLETEMVVKNWVLCISQPLAEELAHAREVSVESARATYASLAGAKSCGQFPELRVILRQPLYASAAESGTDARVFGALVNLSGDWASAFVVSGGLPSE
jgi:hypothetical protein